MLSVFAITALYTELRILKQEMLLTFIFFFRVCAILILKPKKASVLSSYSYPNAARMPSASKIMARANLLGVESSVPVEPI